MLMVVSLSISLGSYRLSRNRETVPGQRLLEAVEDEFSPLSNSGCIANFGETRAHPCFFGDKQSDTTVALFGDSHAAHWFPAFEKIAQERNWKLVTFLKFACPTADVPVYNPRLGRVETECGQWRNDAVQQIVALHPNLIVVGNSSSYVNHSKPARGIWHFDRSGMGRRHPPHRRHFRPGRTSYRRLPRCPTAQDGRAGLPVASAGAPLVSRNLV